MYAPRRAALLALCAIAVVLAASLFPAVGFGSYPAGTWNGPPGGSVSGPADGQPSQSDVPTPTNEKPGQSNPPTDSGDTATPTPTPTPTATPAESGGGDAGGGGDEITGLAALLPVLAVFGGFALVLALGLKRAGYRRRGFWFVHPSLPDLPPAFVRNALAAIPQATMGFVVAVSATLPRLLDDTATVLGAAGAAAVTVGRGAARATRLTLVTLPAGLAAGFGGIASGFGRALGALPGATSSLGGQTVRDRSATDDSTEEDAATLEEDLGPLTVEEAWAEMTDRVPIHNRNAATPGQYARTAVRRGLPSRPVGRLTRLFREVRYGGRSGDERFADAIDAYDDIDGDGDGDDGGEDA